MYVNNLEQCLAQQVLAIINGTWIILRYTDGKETGSCYQMGGTLWSICESFIHSQA